MFDLNYEITRTAKNGDKDIAGFSGGMRQVELNLLEEGDVFTFPDKIQARETLVNGRKAEYCFVVVQKKGNPNAKQYVQFYPGTFTKSIAVVDANNMPTGTRVHTTGSAAEEFWSHPTIAEAMDAMAGKTCKVTKSTMVHTFRFGSTTETRDTSVLTIDFIEAAAQPTGAEAASTANPQA